MIGVPLRDGSGQQVGTVCMSELKMRRRILLCPVCKRRTRHVVQDEPWSYYSPIITCVACGDSWSDGELHERPFRRGWRVEAINRAKRLWAAAPPARARSSAPTALLTPRRGAGGAVSTPGAHVAAAPGHDPARPRIGEDAAGPATTGDAT